MTTPDTLTHVEDRDSDSTPTNSSDEFDWEAEEEEERQTSDPKKAKRIRRLWLLYHRLSRGVRLLILGVLGTGICMTPYIVFRLRFRNSVAYDQATAWSIWLSIAFAAAVVTALFVGALPRFIIWVILAFYGKTPEKVKSYIELVMAVSGPLKLALDIGWLWLSLSGVRAQMKPPGSYWSTVNRVVAALFAAGAILFAEKLVLRFIAINFHRKALADRLLENQLGLRALDKLAVAPATQKSNTKRRQRRPFGSRSSSVEMLSGAITQSNDLVASVEPSPHPSNSNSPTNEKVRPEQQIPSSQRRKRRRKLTANVLHQLGGAIAELALKDSKLNRAGEIGSLYSARQLARQLFSNLSAERSHLVVQDFYPYFRDQEDATAAFALFDQDGNGDISKKEMRNAVQRIYKERKALMASLKDMSSAVAKLDGVLIGVGLLIVLFICLLIFNPGDTVTSLVPLATIVLGFSFIFGHSAQLLFESLIFIFSTHPFDVGDLVIIDDSPLFVKEFGLYSTVFTRVDGQQLVAPNALLASTKLLHNVRRSGSMWESTNLMVSYDTPLTQIELLKTKLRAWMAQPDNSREWGSPGCEVWIDKMDFQNDIQLIVAIEHRANWQAWGDRWGRRTKFMRHLKTVLEELEMGYRMPLQPVSFHPASALQQLELNNMSGPHGVHERSGFLGRAPSAPSAHIGRYY